MTSISLVLKNGYIDINFSRSFCKLQKSETPIGHFQQFFQQFTRKCAGAAGIDDNLRNKFNGDKLLNFYYCVEKNAYEELHLNALKCGSLLFEST